MRRPIDLPPAPDPDPYLDPLARAVVSEVYERGRQASVAGLIARAEVPSSVFVGRYDTLEDCAADAYGSYIASFKRRIGKAFNAFPDWRTSLRAAAHESADFITEERVLAAFGMTGVLQMKSEVVRVLREEVFVFCAKLIDLGRTEPGARAPKDGSAATYAIGSILQLLTHRLQAEEEFDPHEIVPEMMYGIVRTYQGDEAAEEELTLPRPQRDPAGSSISAR